MKFTATNVYLRTHLNNKSNIHTYLYTIYINSILLERDNNKVNERVATDSNIKRFFTLKTDVDRTMVRFHVDEIKE